MTGEGTQQPEGMIGSPRPIHSARAPWTLVGYDENGFACLDEECPGCSARALIISELNLAECLACSWQEGTPGHTWHMYANDHGDGRLAELGEPWQVELHGLGLPVTAVRVTEVGKGDPAATHWGWLPQGKAVPEMIWDSWAAYRVQFPYGPRAEEEHGQGRTLRLAVTRLGDGDEPPLWGFRAAGGAVLPQTVLCGMCECKRPRVRAAREAAQASPDWDREPSRTDCTGVPGLACTACGYRPAPGRAAGGEGRET